MTVSPAGGRPGSEEPVAALSARTIAAASLALLGLYQLVRLVGPASVPTEAFPLGGPGSSTALRATAIPLGLLFGWGIPGLPLAVLMGPGKAPFDLMGRALGGGVAYVFGTGLVVALVTGAAPSRAPLLVLLALPSVALLFASRPRLTRGQSLAVLWSLATVALVGAVLWPKLAHEAMNGDGTELYELSRSLDSHPLPYWDHERSAAPGQATDTGDAGFGVPITVPYFVGAYVVHGAMTLLGRGELATRLPFVWSFVLLVVVTAGLCRNRGATGWMYLAGIAGVYLLWAAHFVGYDPPFDVAEPAGTNTLTAALWMAGITEILTASPAIGIGWMSLAAGTTWSAPILTGLAVLASTWLDRNRRRAALRWGSLGVVLFVVFFACVASLTGAWDDWHQQVRSEYWADLVDPARRVPSLPLLGYALLATGGLPIIAFARWRHLGPSGRALLVTGTAYLVVVLAASNKSLHYLMPLPWLLAVPALEASGAHLRIAAAAALAGTAVLSWPRDGGIRRDTADLGRESCVNGFTYEAAVHRADLVYQVLGYPGSAARFAVGKHTFVRYAMDLGGNDCVLGLSPRVPAGGIVLARGDSAVLWTRDPDRLAKWKLLTVPWPSASLFPRVRPAALSPDVDAWPRRIVLSSEEARALLINEPGAGSPLVSDGAATPLRMLVPARRGTTGLLLGYMADSVREVRAEINGVLSQARIQPDSGTVILTGPVQAGWNVLELRGASATAVWVAVQPGTGGQ